MYLCAVRDGHSRMVLGRAMESVQDTYLVERALRMPHTLRRYVPGGLVLHDDRGTQFTSEQLWEVCRNLGIAQSVGQTGLCFDNAKSESFWATLQTEFYDRQRWSTRDTAPWPVLTGLKTTTTADVGTPPSKWSVLAISRTTLG